ncbi:hypothetical protein CB1_001657002 [Camelus ferus]|nr:hypothetical protein CB1_001657002 [Camelus ferus]
MGEPSQQLATRGGGKGSQGSGSSSGGPAQGAGGVPGGVRARHPELSAAGKLEPKLPEGGCPQPWLAVAAERQLPDLPEAAERSEEDAAAGGSDGRRGSPEPRRDQQRLKFLLSRCLLSGSVACGFPPPSPRLPVSSLFFPAREYLKGTHGPFHASLYTLQTLVWQVLLVNTSIHKPGCPTAPSEASTQTKPEMQAEIPGRLVRSAIVTITCTVHAQAVLLYPRYYLSERNS